jgi:hypothetical protein
MSANFSNGALPPHATRSKELLVLVTFPFRAGRENFFRPGGGAKTAFAPDLARITKEKNDKAVISEMCRSRSLCVQLSTTCVFQGLVRSILRGAGTGHHEEPCLVGLLEQRSIGWSSRFDPTLLTSLDPSEY